MAQCSEVTKGVKVNLTVKTPFDPLNPGAFLSM